MVQKTNVVNRKPSVPRKKKHTGLIITVIIIVIAIIMTGVLLFINRNKIFQNNSSREQEKSISDNDKSTKESEAKTAKSEDKKQNTETREEEKPPVAPYEGEDPNKLEQITGVINFAGISESNFTVTAALDQELGDSGLCKFSILRNSETVIISNTATAAGPTTSFCTYSTPASGISSGKYTINIEVTANGKKGTIAGEVSI